jgi:hypothetical protein
LIKSNSAENFTQTFYPDSPLNKLSIRFDNLYTYGANTIALNISGGSWYNTGASGEDLFNQVFTSTRTDGSITVSTSGSGNKSFLAHISSVGTDTREIKWNIIGTSNRFDIDYTMDNGSTWSPIVTDYPVYNNPSVGIYQWQVPNTPSTTAQVRVRDRGNLSNVLDISDANFTITEIAPYYSISNINVDYSPFETVVLNWQTSTVNQELIDLHYTLDGGTNWIVIEEDFSATYNGNNVFSGSYSWDLPIGPPNQFQVRVSDPSDFSIGASTNVSTIREYLTVYVRWYYLGYTCRSIFWKHRWG